MYLFADTLTWRRYGPRFGFGAKEWYVRFCLGGPLPEWSFPRFGVSRHIDHSRGATVLRFFSWRRYRRHCWHLVLYPFSVSVIHKNVGGLRAMGNHFFPRRSAS